MTHLIDKSPLLAEIERTEKILNIDDVGGHSVMVWCEVFKNFIDTLEVKEIDLEKEIDFAMPSKYCWSGDGEAVYSKEQMRNFAKYFFELGLKVQKGK